MMQSVTKWSRCNRNTDTQTLSVRGAVFTALLLFSAALFLLSLFSGTAAAESYWRGYQNLQKNYNLYGTIGLTYQREWMTGEKATTTFTQSYDLGLRGYIWDPRLVYFDVSGYFTRSSNDPGENFTILGQNVRLTLLQQLPQKWQSKWMYIPNPIVLRFSHYSNSADYTNFGISLVYRKPTELLVHEQQVQQQQQKSQGGNRGNRGNSENNEDLNGDYDLNAGGPASTNTNNNAQLAKPKSFLGLKFPTTYFDYDYYTTKTDGESTTTHLYSLRSFMQGEVYDYRFTFEHEDTSGSVYGLKRTLLQLEPNYHFRDPKTQRTLDILNTLRYQSIDEQKTYEVHSRANLYQPFGNDLLAGSGSLDYVRTSNNGETNDSFNASTTVSYNRVVSPRLSYQPFVTLLYGTGNNDAGDNTYTHAERVGSSVAADLSSVFRNNSSVFIGNASSGFEYGAETVFSTKTRVSASLGYSYSNLAPENGRLSTHRVFLNASAPIVTNISFNSYADYTRTDNSDPANASVQDTLRGGANINLYFYRTSVTLGGSYAKVKSRNGTESQTDVTTLSATLSRVIARNAMFSFYGLWIRDSLKNKTLELTPRLSWFLRQTALEVEYKYRRFSLLGAADTTDHRLTISLTRAFSRNFRR
jgi:hypothetical protein